MAVKLWRGRLFCFFAWFQSLNKQSKTAMKEADLALNWTCSRGRGRFWLPHHTLLLHNNTWRWWNGNTARPITNMFTWEQLIFFLPLRFLTLVFLNLCRYHIFVLSTLISNTFFSSSELWRPPHFAFTTFIITYRPSPSSIALLSSSLFFKASFGTTFHGKVIQVIRWSQALLMCYTPVQC